MGFVASQTVKKVANWTWPILDILGRELAMFCSLGGRLSRQKWKFQPEISPIGHSYCAKCGSLKDVLNWTITMTVIRVYLAAFLILLYSNENYVIPYYNCGMKCHSGLERQ